MLVNAPLAFRRKPVADADSVPTHQNNATNSGATVGTNNAVMRHWHIGEEPAAVADSARTFRSGGCSRLPLPAPAEQTQQAQAGGEERESGGNPGNDRGQAT